MLSNSKIVSIKSSLTLGQRTIFKLLIRWIKNYLSSKNNSYRWEVPSKLNNKEINLNPNLSNKDNLNHHSNKTIIITTKKHLRLIKSLQIRVLSKKLWKVNCQMQLLNKNRISSGKMLPVLIKPKRCFSKLLSCPWNFLKFLLGKELLGEEFFSMA